MDEELARRSHAVLMQAIEVDAPKREAFLAAVCAGDARLRDCVASLQAAMSHSNDFLETPALVRPGASERPASRTPQKTIGAYRIVRVIGVGGMATVYEAIQDKPQRRVALKVMRQGLVHTSAVNRFRYETEVLARIQHPGIVQIFEAGAWDEGHGVSTPFFAMEYVSDALTLTAYAGEHNLSLADRLTLFATVCDAVQHGHQHGVIHRDLKPGNVLVDPAGTAKVIDFGVARAIDTGQEWLTRHTDHGQLIGTLNYMSPEQCTGGSDLDIRSDVYSLGVILFELVCGRLPHDLARLPVTEALRIVRDDVPARPSAIDARLRGDIEAIVMTAMEKDPQRRFPTVAALAADIRRHLEHQPIQARPATTIYRVRRFARRHRVLVTASTLVLAVVIGAGAWSTWAMLRWREEAFRAHQATEQALLIKEFLEGMVASADPATGQADVRFVEVLRDAGTEVGERFAGYPEVEADLRSVLSRAFVNLGLYAEALTHARRADELYRELLGLAQPRALQAANNHAWLLYRARDFVEAANICRQIIAQTRGNHDLVQESITAQRTLADVLMFQGELDEAERILMAALANARASLGPEHGETLLVVNDLAAFLSTRVARQRSGDPDRDMRKASELLLSSMDAFVEKFGEDGRHTLLAMCNLATYLMRQQRFDEAEQFAQRVVELAPRRFGEDHGFCILARRELGDIAFGQRRFHEAAQHVVQSVAMIQKRAADLPTAELLSAMSDGLPILDAADEFATGEAYARALCDGFGGMTAHGSTSALGYGLHLARFLSRQGKYDEAEALFAVALSSGPEAPAELRWRIGLCYGGHLAALGRFEEAEPHFLAALEEAPTYPGWSVVVQQELARVYDGLGNREEADRWSILANTPPGVAR